MSSVFKSNLGRRILLLVGMSMLLTLIASLVSGWLAVRQSSARVFHERQSLAQVSATYLDHILRQNLERLDSVRSAPGVDIEDDDPEPEKRALHSTYLGSLFNDGVFITNQQGIVLWIEPLSPNFVGTNIGGYQPIQQSLTTGKPIISDILTVEPAGKKVILMIIPLHNREGRIVGLVGGQIDPLGRTLQEFIPLIELEEESYLDVVDTNGVVLASSEPQRILKIQEEMNHQGQAEVIVLAPLSVASWSVAVIQSAAVALAPVRTIEQRFIILGLASLVIIFFFSWGMARSLIRPIGQLATATRNISQGNLSRPIPQLGSDEIGELGRSFDTMRIALKKSLEEIQQWNKELEAKVAERTRELEESYREVERKEAARGELLRKVLTAQEEERKRLARELHDETTQLLAGLLMRLEVATIIPDETAGKIKNLLIRAIDSVHKIIFDLRPSILDDLGLLSALRWYAENRLGELNIKTRVEVTGEERKLPLESETALFRVAQEAITNIIKHAEAQNVVLSVEFANSTLRIEVEDDGKGFDVEAISLQADKAQGLGLLGMKERVNLLGGEFRIESQPSQGTRLIIEVPLE